MGQWLMDQFLAWLAAYLAANWMPIGFFLIATTAFCSLVRKLLERFGYLPMIAGVLVLIAGAWAMGAYTAPTKEVVRDRVRTVERKIIDESLVRRLRGQIAGLEGQIADLERRMADMAAAKDATIASLDAARRRAEADAARLRSELAAALAEIQRLKAAKDMLFDDNGACPQCGHTWDVPKNLKNEQVRCRKCGRIMSAKTAWAWRAEMKKRGR